MPVEDAFDLAGFFDEDDFAVHVDWTLADGTAATKPLVQSFTPAESIGLGAPDLIMDLPAIHVPVSDLPVGYGKGDAVKLRGVDYTVAERPELKNTATIAVAKLRRV